MASTAITVQRQDQFGNANTTDATRTVTLSSNSSGTVTFTPASPLSIPNGSSSASFTYTDTKAGTPTITAASTSPSTITSATQQETVIMAAANKLAFGQQPSTTTAGNAIGPSVTVQIPGPDSANPTSSTASIAMAIGTTRSSGTLSGTTTTNAVNGVATFSGLSINDVGNSYTLQATSGSLTLATSSAFNITTRAITVTAATNTKTYDGTVSAAATPTITSGTLASGDTANFIEAYSSKNVGTGLTLTPSGTVTNGANDVTANYTITFVNNTTGVISARALTVTAATNTKTYDGTASAAAAPTITSGALQTGDTANFTESYSNKNAGVGNKTLIPTGTISDGNSGNNYTYTFVNFTTATINSEALTVTAATNSKGYDGTASAAATPTITSGAVQSGDTANFTEAYSSKNVGTGLTLTPSGTVTDGNSGNNYAVTFVTNATGIITARAITVTAVATNTKVYDATTNAAAVPTITFGTLAAGDTASFTEAYSTKNAGTSLTLTPSGSVSDGNSGKNYAVTFVTNTTGVITARSITVTAATNSKTYDGTTTAAATPTITSGTVQIGDTANFTESYSTKNAGVGNKTLIPTGTVSDGNSGNNYTYTFVNFTTGTINKLAITVTAATNTKTYDGTTSAAATPTITAGTLQTSVHGEHHGKLQQQECGCRQQDVDTGGDRQRRQQREQLHLYLRDQHHGTENQCRGVSPQWRCQFEGL